MLLQKIRRGAASSTPTMYMCNHATIIHQLLLEKDIQCFFLKPPPVGESFLFLMQLKNYSAGKSGVIVLFSILSFFTVSLAVPEVDGRIASGAYHKAW